ncbi:hypothetical protein ACILDT_09345 [Capnocytophaga canis]|uniref:hypothetical protein n=1 Tax=Capnocytophaga canis TaxID=1848903 RepID=UPI0037D3BC90
MLMIASIFVACGKDREKGGDDNTDNSLAIAPPAWIQAEWLPLSGKKGLVFKADDFCFKETDKADDCHKGKIDSKTIRVTKQTYENKKHYTIKLTDAQGKSQEHLFIWNSETSIVYNGVTYSKKSNDNNSGNNNSGNNNGGNNNGGNNNNTGNIIAIAPPAWIQAEWYTLNGKKGLVFKANDFCFKENEKADDCYKGKIDSKAIRVTKQTSENKKHYTITLTDAQGKNTEYVFTWESGSRISYKGTTYMKG